MTLLLEVTSEYCMSSLSCYTYSVHIDCTVGMLCGSMLHRLSSREQWTKTSSYAGSPRHFTLSRSAFLFDVQHIYMHL